MAITAATFRKLALALPDAVEGEHHSHPDFRLNGRVFASLHPDGVRAMVRIAPGADQERLVVQDPAAWSLANGAWGRGGCMMLVLARAQRSVVQAALTEAWQVAVAQAPAKPRRKQPVPRSNKKPRR